MKEKKMVQEHNPHTGTLKRLIVALAFRARDPLLCTQYNSDDVAHKVLLDW